MTPEFYRDADEFLASIISEYYQNASGQKDTLDLSAIYRKYGWLFERDIVEKALAAGLDETAGRFTAAFVVDGYLSSITRELEEQIENAVTQSKVEWDGSSIPYRKVQVVIQNEPQASRRHDLEKRQQAVTEEHNPKRLERMRMLHAGAEDLGFDNYARLYDCLRDLRLDWLLEQMEKLVKETEKVYRQELAHFLTQIGVDPDEATPADMLYIIRSPRFDALFPKDDMVPAFKRTMIGLGIDLMLQDNLHLDIEPRPLKSPRAFCAPVRVPEDVKLVIMPRGGQDDYRAMFHEGGHAEHFANVRPDLEVPFRRFGDNAVTESFAFLLEYLLKSREWWSRIMNRTDIDDYLRLSRFHKLWLLRRYAAKLHYEQKLHTSADPEQARAEYAAVLTSVTGLKYPEANYLADVDDGLYAALYIQAWMFEVQLRYHLEYYYDKSWFASRRAGGFLRELWREGQAFPVADMAKQFGKGLKIDPLIAELNGV